MKHRITRTASGWALDGFAIRHGDAIRAWVVGECRDATFWAGYVAMIVRRLGGQGAELDAGILAEGVDVRWPDGAARVNLN
jgi:hypothetical protein